MVVNPSLLCHFKVGGTSKELFLRKNCTYAPNLVVLVFFHFSFLFDQVYKWQELKKKHYTLHSGSEMVKLPAQIQISNDSEFLAKVLQNDQDSDSGESCNSDLNCSAVVERSDNERVDKRNTLLPILATSDTQTSLSDVAVQLAINVQILCQLLAISDRLQVLEKNNVKKYSDPKKMKGASKKKTS